MVKSNIPLQEAKNLSDPYPKVEVITKGTTMGTSLAPLGKIKIKIKRPTTKESSALLKANQT